MLTLVVPYYNHPNSLPRLLDSVLAQTLKDITVVLVDDGSEQPCDSVVRDYKEKGLRVDLLKVGEHRGTKHARLLGMEAASTRIIGFADADDVLWGTETLELHVRRMLDEGADMLHCNMFDLDDDGGHIYQWAGPITERSEGLDTFSHYVRENMRGHNVYTKLISRDLCRACIPFARQSRIRRYMEDFLLASLFFFHSRTYIGSELVGYARKPRNTKAVKTPGRLVALSLLLHEFVPYVLEQGCPLPLAEACSHSLRHKIQRTMRDFHQFEQTGMYATADSLYASAFLEHGDEVTVVQALLEGHPLVRSIQCDRKNRELRSVLKKGHPIHRLSFAARDAAGLIAGLFRRPACK